MKQTHFQDASTESFDIPCNCGITDWTSVEGLPASACQSGV